MVVDTAVSVNEERPTSHIKLATYNILSGRKGRLETALREMKRMNVDIGLLTEAKLTNGNHHIMMAIQSGKAIRFPESLVRPMGRNASGVRGVTLAHENDELVGMVCVEEGDAHDILVVSEKGYGKRSAKEDYRITNTQDSTSTNPT